MLFPLFCAFIFVGTFQNCLGSNNKKLETGHNCTVNGDCPGENVFCNKNNVCECEISFIPNVSFGNEIVCSEFECSNNSECEEYFGTNVNCNSDFKQCECETSFHYSRETGQCWTNATLLHGACGSWKQCGKYSNCERLQKGWIDDPDVLNGTCECLIGFHPVNDYGCELTTFCHQDSDCSTHQNHTVCNEICECEDGFHQNVHDTRCINGPMNLTQACEISENCGANTECVQGQCQCVLLSRPSTENGYDCVDMKCHEDSDCQKYDSNSACAKLFHLCYCQTGLSDHDNPRKCGKQTSATAQNDDH